MHFPLEYFFVLYLLHISVFAALRHRPSTVYPSTCTALLSLIYSLYCISVFAALHHRPSTVYPSTCTALLSLIYSLYYISVFAALHHRPSTASRRTCTRVWSCTPTVWPRWSSGRQPPTQTREFTGLDNGQS